MNNRKEEPWRKYFVHKTSCGKPILDKKGNIIICCGEDLSGFNNEFAQCFKCVQRDIDDAKKILNKLKEKK
jgi:hypothetical protein